MISKLPRWVWWGAWALAFVAGMVNVIGLLSFDHQTVSHLTGTTTMLAMSVGQGDGAAILHFGLVLGSFLAGTVLSGLIVQDTALQLGRRYGVAMFIESMLFVAAVPLLNRANHGGLYLAAMACGLQNAMISTYSGTVIRTTHVSGMFTDLGIFLGHTLRGLKVDQRRFRMCALVISGFFCGACFGTVIFRWMKYSALYIPAALTGIAAVSYAIHRLSHPVK